MVQVLHLGDVARLGDGGALPAAVEGEEGALEALVGDAEPEGGGRHVILDQQLGTVRLVVVDGPGGVLVHHDVVVVLYPVILD